MHRTICLWACVSCFILLLAACATDQLPLTSTIDVQITQTGCHPMAWRVPAGQVVSLKISNKAVEDYTWTFMGRPVTPPFDAADAANVFFTRQVTAGASANLQFTTPAAAGEYQAICTPYNHPDDEQTGRITVVQP